MNLIDKVTRKSMKIRPSGRSTDFISPSFGHGCLYNCNYCYMKRHKPKGLSVAKNYWDILSEINSHATFDTTEKPNQTHDEYVTYDISCNEDFALHAKYHEWERIFDFFKEHPRAMGSFATKYVNKDFLNYDPKGKIRIRFSLIPETIKELLEPHTSSVYQRVSAINDFIEAGYDVHINFSPVVVFIDWLEDYLDLFALINGLVKAKYKPNVKAEVIFLTHNENKHKYNLDHNLPGEDFIWDPEIQETKKSQYGGDNLRYKHDLKAEYIKQWTEVHDRIIPWNKIRYIF